MVIGSIAQKILTSETPDNKLLTKKRFPENVLAEF